MCIPLSVQSTKELEDISPGVAVMLLVLLHFDLVVHGTCFTLSQHEVHQLGGKSKVQALFAGYVFF
jgi:ribonuclease I